MTTNDIITITNVAMFFSMCMVISFIMYIICKLNKEYLGSFMSLFALAISAYMGIMPIIYVVFKFVFDIDLIEIAEK